MSGWAVRWEAISKCGATSAAVPMRQSWMKMPESLWNLKGSCLNEKQLCKLNLRSLPNRGVRGRSPCQGRQPARSAGRGVTAPSLRWAQGLGKNPACKLNLRSLPARLQTEPPQSAPLGVRGRSPCKGRQPVKAEPNRTSADCLPACKQNLRRLHKRGCGGANPHQGRQPVRAIPN